LAGPDPLLPVVEFATSDRSTWTPDLRSRHRESHRRSFEGSQHRPGAYAGWTTLHRKAAYSHCRPVAAYGRPLGESAL